MYTRLLDGRECVVCCSSIDKCNVTGCIWALHVTRNWRVTLWIDHVEREICDVNFEDYH
jgi:hypothetical protein